MKATGIVVEHNPYHNGHAYHASQAREITDSDVVVAVMSGNFLQRGEPALVDKWTRAKMSLSSDVDLVVELPYRYATASAKEFATGSIFLLDALKCSSFVFGSEQGSIDPFLRTYELIHSNRSQYNATIQQSLKTGRSYPQALQDAFQALSGASSEKQLVDLSMPNNILGFHYVEAATALNLPIQPHTIQRIGAGYHDFIDPSQAIASATGIRKALFDTQEISAAARFLPNESRNQLELWWEKYNQFGSWTQFWPVLRYAIVSKSPEQLRSIAEVSEGIEFAIRKHAISSASFEEFMQKLKSKRYTWTRLQRMLAHIFTGFTEDMRTSALPDAIRLLGMTAKGQRYLNHIKKDISLPLVSRLASSDSEYIKQDTKASDLYYLGFSETELHSLSGQEYKKLPITI